MIACTKCGSNSWKSIFRCVVDPANDKFACNKCGHQWKRYDKPIPRETTMPEITSKEESFSAIRFALDAALSKHGIVSELVGHIVEYRREGGVFAQYYPNSENLVWREGGTSKDEDKIVRAHANFCYPKNERKRAIYVIQRNDGAFATPPGQQHSYSNNLQDARTFYTREKAQKELCVENERVVAIADLMNRPE